MSSDGYYQVRQAQEGEQRVVSAWAPSPLIAQGLEVSNRLRVIAEGGQAEVSDQWRGGGAVCAG